MFKENAQQFLFIENIKVSLNYYQSFVEVCGKENKKQQLVMSRARCYHEKQQSVYGICKQFLDIVIFGKSLRIKKLSRHLSTGTTRCT